MFPLTTRLALRNMRAYSGNQNLLKAATLLLGSKLTTQAETEELTKVVYR